MPAPRVLVSILHYNSPAHAAETVRCFREQQFASFDLEIIDNVSRPDALADLRQRLPTVSIRAMSENRGYTGGNNQALLRGVQDGYDYVVIANDDIEVDRDAVSCLIETAQNHPDAGVIGAVEVSYRTGQVRVARGSGCSLWTGREQWQRHVNMGAGPVVEAEYVQGALVVFTKAAIDAGISFDDNYFMYYDEIDLGFALKRAGLRAYVDQRVKVRHKSDPLSFDPRSGYLHQRNRMYLVNKFGRWYHRLCYQLYAGLLEVPAKAVIRTAQGHGSFARACVVGHVDGLLGRMGRGRLRPDLDRTA